MKNFVSILSYVCRVHLIVPVLVAMLVLPGLVVLANEAPGSRPYEGENTRGTDEAAFNIFSGDIPGVPSNAGEQDFVTVAPHGTLDWTNNLEVCEGKFDIAFYLHNGAEDAANGENLDGAGVATGVRMKITLPNGESTTHEITGTVTAENVATIVDQANVYCDGHKITLDYVEGSAQIFRQYTGQFHPLSDDIVGPNGVLVGFETDNGIIPGCWEYRVIVKLTVEVEKFEEPVEPIYECSSLTALPTSVKVGETVKFTATAKAENGATISKYAFAYGDGETTDVTTSATTANAEHAYDTKGEYTAQVTVSFDVNGETATDTGDQCKVKVTVTEEEEPPVQPPVTPPEQLPDTGIGSALAGFFGTSALFASARNWFTSRKLVRSALRGES